MIRSMATLTPPVTDEQSPVDSRPPQVSQFEAEVRQILERYGVTDLKDLDLQLADAAVFYQVGAGQASAGQLMEAFLRMFPRPAMDRMVRELKEWLFVKGYLLVPEVESLRHGQVASKDWN